MWIWFGCHFKEVSQLVAETVGFSGEIFLNASKGDRKLLVFIENKSLGDLE